MLVTLSPDLLKNMDAYWRAANYLTVGQIYLQDNPLSTPLSSSNTSNLVASGIGAPPWTQLHLCSRVGG